MIRVHDHKQGGFTLIEIIIALVVVSILAAMTASFFGTSLMRSGDPVIHTGKALSIQNVMENITAECKRSYNPVTNEFDLAGLKTNIGAEGSLYNNSFGQYKVIENRYIAFTSSGSQISAPSGNYRLLKVTVQDYGGGTGESLTTVFAQPTL